MRYIIVTPAYNEDKYIVETIKSVIAQSIKPSLWVIVDDDSTDKTALLIKQYTKQNSWIKYLHRKKILGQTYYGSNVYAIRDGLKQISNIDYEYLAILDADISLLPDYYEKLLSCMEKDDKLGIASGVYMDRVGENKFRKVLNDRRSTPKALMIFRKQCFDDIGGFVPMKYGYEDTCACFAARMKGWKTWSFPDLIAVHNKPVGTGHSNKLTKIRFRLGMGEYFAGSHPLFAFLKSLKRCFKEKPFLLGGIARFAGYLYGAITKEKLQIPKDLFAYIRREQLDRILHRNKIPIDYQIDKITNECISKGNDR